MFITCTTRPRHLEECPEERPEAYAGKQPVPVSGH